MARNFIRLFSTVFFFAVIIMVSVTAQMAFGAPHNPSVRKTIAERKVAEIADEVNSVTGERFPKLLDGDTIDRVIGEGGLKQKLKGFKQKLRRWSVDFDGLG
ncbi:hypothetical protein MKX03_015212 [Papaver bracteatum]|nr:hypothetical protein MKX03_015212 [Papaver bracteatum]